MSRVPTRAHGSLRLTWVRAVPTRRPGALGAHRARAGRGSHSGDDLVPRHGDAVPEVRPTSAAPGRSDGQGGKTIRRPSRPRSLLAGPMSFGGRGGLRIESISTEVPMTAIYAASHDAGSSRGGREQASTTLEAVAPGSPRSRKALWAGRVMSGFAVLFLLVDATLKVLELPPAVEGTTQLGFTARVIYGLGQPDLAFPGGCLVPRAILLR